MSNKFDSTKIPVSIQTPIYTLTRLNDGLTKTGYRIQYIEWNEDGTANKSHDDIQIGYSLMLDPSMSYKWLTTAITEIISHSEDYIKFQTKNSLYELTKNIQKKS